SGASIGVWEWDLGDGTLLWDDIMYELYGLTKAQAEGNYQDWQRAVLPEDLAETEAKLTQAVAESTLFEHTFRIRHPEKGIRYMQAVAQVEQGKQGVSKRMIGVNWDITETKRVEEEIRKARSLAEEMLRLKSNFLANMSHEIRTPLNGILGVARIMQEEEDLNEVRHMLDMLALSGRRLLATLTGILELAKIEAEQDEYALEEVPMTGMVHEVVESLRPLAMEKGLEFRFEPHCTMGKVLADRRLLGQILSNIIGNALKFTSEGYVKVQLNCTANRKGVKLMEIAVRDTGVGIDPKNQERIFEPFKQESEGQSRRFQGSGLGLAIAKKYTELLGGSIRVESAKGQGSTFFIYLPQTATISHD
ncbi:MAG: hybrid sensor histidine kinase/response regulator, partial [Bacteroidetes bacterium]